MRHSITVTLILFCLSGIIILKAQEREEENKGLIALKNNNISAAEEYFKESITKNRDAASFYQLGKLQLSKNTFNSRNEALENLKQAALREPDNFEYRLTYATILEEFANRSAYKEYESLIALFPGKIEPFLALGKLTLKNYIEFKNSKSLGQYWAKYPGENLADLDLEAQVKIDSVETVKWFDKALEIDPSSEEAFLSLGKLYEHAKKYDKAIGCCNKALIANDKSIDTHLLLGIIYNRIGELKKANFEFLKAMDLMSDLEREDFMYSSVLKVLSPKHILDKKYKSKKEIEDYIMRYWRMADPQQSAEYNQTLLEHYSRVAYANLWFSVPKYGITGWKTERGEVCLRYGLPNNIVKYRPTIDYLTGAFYSKSDIWSYDGFILSFDDYNISGDSKLSFNRSSTNPRSNFGSAELFNKLRSRIHSTYMPKGKKFSVPTRLLRFKGANKNQSEYYLVYPLPLTIKDQKINLKNASWEYGLYCYDNDLNVVQEKRGSYDKNEIAKLAKEQLNKEMISNIKLTPPVSASTFKFQITRNTDSSFYSYTLPYEFKNYDAGAFSISDAVLASAVNEEREITGAIKRGDFYIVPSANNVFKQNEAINLYYELYSLKTGNDNLTDFEQTITIEKSDGKGSRGEVLLETIWNGIKKIFKGDDNKLSLSSSYKTKETDTRQYLQLDFSKYPIGLYNITIKIHDKVSGNKVEKKLLMSINSA